MVSLQPAQAASEDLGGGVEGSLPRRPAADVDRARWRSEGLGHGAQEPGVSDGLYQVTTRYLCAGFMVESGRVTMCAPILRKKLAYWKTIAKKVS